MTDLNAHDTHNVATTSPANDVTIDPAAEPLTAEEARELTEMIRTAADTMWYLLARAHTGRAWEPLGYTTFSDYVAEEFAISRSRAYQLINHAKVFEALKAATPDGTDIRINEATSRDVYGVLDQVANKVSAATTGLTPDDAASKVEEIVDAARAEAKAAKNAPIHSATDSELGLDPAILDDDFAAILDDEETLTPVPVTPPGHPGTASGLTVNPGAATPDDIDILPPTVTSPTRPTAAADPTSGTRPADVRRYVRAVYDFYSIIMSVRDLPEPEAIIPLIPPERQLAVTDGVPQAINWLERFSDAWAERDVSTTTEPADETADETD